MGEELTIAKLTPQHSKVSIQGWITHVRRLGGVIFLGLRDSTGLIQVVVSKDKIASGITEAQQLKQLDFINIQGVLNWSTGNPELIAESIELVNHGANHGLPGRHLELRNNQNWAIFRIRDQLVRGLELFLRGNEFISAPPPTIIPRYKSSDFDFIFYEKPATLSQSGALYMSALALSLGRVYSIHPVFRSEKSKTKRHLAEFWMLEFEAITMDFDRLVIFTEALIKKTIQEVLENCTKELKILGRELSHLNKMCHSNFPRMDYTEVVERLQAEGHEMKWGKGLGKYEKIVSQWHDLPIFVLKFPRSIGSWTAQPQRHNVSLSINVLAPGGYGEILEGCQRNIDASILDKKFQIAGVNLGWYADVHRCGGILHSGAGLGIERLCQWVCGVDNIRSVIPFPRSLKDFYP